MVGGRGFEEDKMTERREVVEWWLEELEGYMVKRKGVVDGRAFGESSLMKKMDMAGRRWSLVRHAFS